MKIRNNPDDFKPKLIDPLFTIQLMAYISEEQNTCQKYANELLANGWNIYAVNQKRGRCYEYAATITIPVWAVKRGTDYLNYYLSHELAHAKAGCKNDHNSIFMQAFKSICEEKNWHYEIPYKGYTAILNGIAPLDF